MKEKSFCIYIHRLLKQIRPDLQISKDALGAFDSINRKFAKEISQKALVITQENDRKTVSVSDLETAIKLVFNVSFIEKIMKYAKDACEKFEDFEKSDHDKKSSMRETKAGLIFSVSVTEKYLRRFGQSDFHVSSCSPVFLAGILENISEMILEDTCNVVTENKKVVIQTRHIFLGIAKNTEILRLFEKLNMFLIGSGVEAHIEKSILDSTKIARTSSGKWAPGAKTISNIKNLQKSTKLLMQHAPMCRLIREVGEILSENDLRYTKEFLICMHHLIENCMIKVMKGCMRLALHDSRETVYAKDIILIRELTEPFLDSCQELKNNIPLSALRHLSLRAGVKRYGEDSTEEYKKLLSDFLYTFMRDIILCTEHQKLHTVSVKVMLEALSLRGINVLTIPKRKHRKKSSSDTESVATATESVASNVESVPESLANEEEEDEEENIPDVPEEVDADGEILEVSTESESEED